MNFQEQYPQVDDDDFQQQLLNKTEFVQIDKKNVKTDEIYFTFQRNIAILLSPVTPYKKMMFYWEPGVGKSLASILVHELTKQFLNGDMRQSVIVTKGKSLEDNYKTEFLKANPGIDLGDKTAVNRTLKSNFVFKKYAAFASALSKSNDEWIKNTYSNRIFILDEAHALKNFKSDTYKQYLRLFSVAENLTIILLTGTPNTDHPSEAVALVNLLKDPEDRITPGAKFMKEYYSNGEFIWEKEDELLTFFHGMVTYLVQTSNVKQSVFEENPSFPSTFSTFSTFNLIMDPFQEKIYKEAILKTHKTVKKVKGENGIKLFKRDKDGKLIEYESKGGGAFMKLAREAEMFCYPNGTFGDDGFKKNMNKVGNKITFKSPETSKEIVSNLKKYSVTFAESFKIIKANPKRIFYIYFDNVNNSGLLLYAKLLELVLGFVQTDAKKSAPSSTPKYIKIDSSVKTPISSLLKKVGSKENADGSLVRVILGSPLSGVGLTIPNATMCMIFDSQFTPSDIVQITNRINRPGTLKHVKDAGLPTDCHNYLFTASTRDKKSVSLDIYEIAQTKVKLIEPQTEIMKRADPFCAVSYKRNLELDENGKPINYECWTAIPDKKSSIWTYNREEDVSTDVLFWRQGEIDELYDTIIEEVKTHPVKISDYIKTYDPMIVYRTVKKITSSNKIITLSRGEKAILFIFGDLIFADVTGYGDPNVSWYLQTKTFQTQITLDDIFSQQYIKDDKPQIEKMIKEKNISVFNKLSKYSKILLWEQSWKKDPLKIKNKFSWFDVDGVSYHILYAEPYSPPITANANAIIIEDKTKIREYVDGNWRFFHGDVDELISKFKITQKTKIAKVETQIDSKYGVYGKYDKKGNFQIVVTGEGGRANTGKRCAFFKKGEQEELYKKFKKLPSGFSDLSVEERCKLIEEAFEEADVLVK